MNRQIVSTCLRKQVHVLELSDEDSSGKENYFGKGGGHPDRVVIDSSDGEFDKILEKLKTRTTIPKKCRSSAKKISKQISNPCSDDSFESLLTRVKTPKSATRKGSVSRHDGLKAINVDSSSDDDSVLETKKPTVPQVLNRVKTPKAQLRKSVSGSEDSLKNFIVDSSDDDDFVFESRKPPANNGSTKSKPPPEVSPQVERRLLSNYDSPVFLTDDDDDDDGVAITSTWRSRHTKYTSGTPRSVAAPAPSSAPPKSSQTKLSGWVSSDDEEEVESLMDRLKKNLRLNSDRAQIPKNKPEPKQKPCLSDSSVKGKIQPKHRREKGSEGNHTPVQPPKIPLVSQTEPRATSGSRVNACKVPGCFLQSLSDPTSSYCRSFKQKKEELTSKLYRLYNTSVFESKLPADMSVTWCNKMRKTAGFCITGQERGTGVRYARIRLSTKVCDSADRLRDTLVHEMCHAAPWLIHNVRDGHGPIWKMFARKATLAHPELPMVSRCHSYDIKYKFQYQCNRCKNTIGRHSKSLDTQRFVCALCTGQLVLLTPSNSRGPTPFAIYVKENYKTIRQQLTGQSHGDVMRKLSADFASKTRLSES
ncbi:germ cell nuclear acidic protein-like isoform X2 [Sardina pilchardus]|uniref:germ cell nuclear acidic protein-like isoform X2 n=1 Tax=Sardina pilchardus TaxID=27697 RepID=UPI002E0E1FA6